MISRFAPAKINLYLHVTGRRADGYHLLDSLVVFAAGIGDAVHIAPAPELQFNVTGSQAAVLRDCAAADNLVLRAAHALAAALGKKLNCAITLEKHLPAASGIGGGSSDAAATLLALAEFWNVPPQTLSLDEIARTLGQDVACCLYRQPCYFEGIGDVLAPAPALPACGIVLVNPQVPVPTPAVFKQRQGEFSAPAPLSPTPGTLAELATQLRARRNDLYAPAVALAPVIGDCLQAMQTLPGCAFAAMSGSGATCFGLFADHAAAKTAAHELQRRQPAWWVASGTLPYAEPAKSYNPA